MVESLCKNCEIKIENVSMIVDLILFELNVLDVILRMNFLAKYHAILDCSNKEVVLKEQEKIEVKYESDKKVELANIILVVKARKLIRKGHVAYLARVVDTRVIRKKPGSVLIVCEYLNVFSKEMSGLL